MSTVVPAAPPSAARLLTCTVAVAAVVVGAPSLVGLAIGPHPDAVAPGTSVVLPDPDEPAVRMAAPAGWAEAEAPVNPERATVYTRDTDTLAVYANPSVLDPDVYAERLLRLSAARSGVTAEAAGRATGGDGLTGPRFRVTDPQGRTGELVVLARGRAAVALFALADPARPVDLRPLLDSLRVAS